MIKPCPFCGEIEDFEVDIFDVKDREGIPQRIQCGNCGAIGPWAYLNSDEYNVDTVAELTKWNERV